MGIDYTIHSTLELGEILHNIKFKNKFIQKHIIADVLRKYEKVDNIHC